MSDFEPLGDEVFGLTKRNEKKSACFAFCIYLIVSNPEGFSSSNGGD